MKKIEILAPCGGFDSVISSVNSGADAVYLGLKDFSARKDAKNFTLDELIKIRQAYKDAPSLYRSLMVYKECNDDKTSDKINEFFSTTTCDVLDIKFSVSCSIYSEDQIYCFSAMIVYK